MQHNVILSKFLLVLAETSTTQQTETPTSTVTICKYLLDSKWTFFRNVMHLFYWCMLYCTFLSHYDCKARRWRWDDKVPLDCARTPMTLKHVYIQGCNYVRKLNSFSVQPGGFIGIKVLATATVAVALVLAVLAASLCLSRNKLNCNCKGEYKAMHYDDTKVT